MENQPSFLEKMMNPVMQQLGYVNKKAIVSNAPTSILGINNTRVGTDYTKTEKGMPKPSNVSFEQLRQVAKYDSLIRICITTIKKQVSQAEWDIIPRKGFPKNQKNIDEVYKLFQFVNSNNENLRVLLDRVIEDLLVLDAGVIEKVYNYKGNLVEINSVDGATIRPRFNEYGEFDEEFAYAQVINNEVTAKFKSEELIYMMQNPQSDIQAFGYGLSPIESVLLAVQASLNADMYNAEVFAQDNIPPGVLDLGNLTDQEAKQFIALWNGTVIGNTQKMKFIWGSESGSKYTPFKGNNKDMQFVEYIDWLSRVKLAAFGLSSIDANILQDVNRATAEVQESLSNSRGVRTVKRLIEEYLNREIILASGYEDVVFSFDKTVSLTEKKKQAEVDKIYIETGVLDPREVADREGFSTDGFGDDDFFDEDEPADGMGTNPNPEDQEGDIDAEEDPEKSVSKSKKGKHWKPLY